MDFDIRNGANNGGFFEDFRGLVPTSSKDHSKMAHRPHFGCFFHNVGCFFDAFRTILAQCWIHFLQNKCTILQKAV